MPHDTSPSGQAVTAAKQNAALADAKAGSPKGTSGTYSDRPNMASPSEATIAKNETNTHPGGNKPAGDTGDTGRKQP